MVCKPDIHMAADAIIASHTGAVNTLLAECWASKLPIKACTNAMHLVLLMISSIWGSCKLGLLDRGRCLVEVPQNIPHNHWCTGQQEANSNLGIIG